MITVVFDVISRGHRRLGCDAIFDWDAFISMEENKVGIQKMTLKKVDWNDF